VNAAIATEWPAPEEISQRERSLLRKIRIAFWCAAVIFGFAQAWDSRFTMNSDGISYLDLGDAYARGGWKMALSTYWSPMYPWLMGMAKIAFKPSAYSEFTVVHLLNFAIFLLSLVAFELMLRELDRFRSAGPRSDTDVPLPTWAFHSIGYLVFLFLSLTLINMERPSPDMLMSVFVYAAMAILLRIQSGRDGWGWFALLGITLGLGYYAKAPMFPLAFVFFGVALLLRSKPLTTFPRVLLSAATFLLLSLPLVIIFSRATGHLTFGESGGWNYMVEVNGVGPVWYMQDPGTAKGKYLHPPQKIFDFPPAYSFVGPVQGTEPAWDEPSYWTAGLRPRLALHRQVSVVLKNADDYFQLVFSKQAGILVLLLVLFLVGSTYESLRSVLRLWAVWIPAVAAMLMYLLVVVEDRYVAVWFTILWIMLSASVRLRGGDQSRRFVIGATCAVLLTLGIPLSVSAMTNLRDSVHRRHGQWELAKRLQAIGVHPGDKVARIGGAHRVEWARLLRLHVIAEIPQEQAEYFWSSSPSVQQQVLDRLRQTGSTAVIAQQMDPWAVFVAGPGWQRLGQSEFYAYLLPAATAKASPESAMPAATFAPGSRK
jgi:hypothetical protein